MLDNSGDSALVNSPIRLMLVDDHELLLLGLRTILEKVDDFQIVAACTTKAEALEAAETKSLDVVIFDLILHGIEEWDTIDRLRQMKPDVKIIVLSAEREEDIGLEALQRTKCGFLNKNLAPELLESYIRRALKGEIVGSSKLHQLMLSVNLNDDPVMQLLTEAQREIFRLLGRGKSVKEVAPVLNVVESTVYNQAKDMCDRLGLDSLHELMYFAVRYDVRHS